MFKKNIVNNIILYYRKKRIIYRLRNYRIKCVLTINQINTLLGLITDKLNNKDPFITFPVSTANSDISSVYNISKELEELKSYLEEVLNRN